MLAAGYKSCSFFNVKTLLCGVQVGVVAMGERAFHAALSFGMGGLSSGLRVLSFELDALSFDQQALSYVEITSLLIITFILFFCKILLYT